MFETRLLLFCLAAAVACARQASPVPTPARSTPTPQVSPAPELSFPSHQVVAVDGIDGIDTYGSTRVDAAELVASHRPLLEAIGAASDMSAKQAAKQKLVEALRAPGEFAYVDASLITYFGPKSGVYLTIDFVEEKDRAARMVFDPKPTGIIADPDGLLQTWQEYFDKAWPLLTTGKIDQSQPCPVHHCIGNFQLPELAPYLPRLRKAESAKANLIEMLRNDADPKKRAAAAFVLAHIDDVDELVSILVSRIRDPSEIARNNVLRVLAIIAMKRPEVDIPIKPILEALNFPSTLDRNKAGAILSGLAKKKEHHAAIVREAGDTLFEMLRLTQPNNHDFAYEILTTISGLDHDPRDYGAWHNWLTSYRENLNSN